MTAASPWRFMTELCRSSIRNIFYFSLQWLVQETPSFKFRVQTRQGIYAAWRAECKGASEPGYSRVCCSRFWSSNTGVLQSAYCVKDTQKAPAVVIDGVIYPSCNRVEYWNWERPRDDTAVNRQFDSSGTPQVVLRETIWRQPQCFHNHLRMTKF